MGTMVLERILYFAPSIERVWENPTRPILAGGGQEMRNKQTNNHNNMLMVATAFEKGRHVRVIL